MSITQTSSRHRPHRHLTALVAAFLVLVATTVALVGAPGSAATANAAPPRLRNPALTGRELSTEYLTILQQGDRAALAKFLDPAFLLQRTDGSGADRAEYLANPATVTSFKIDDVLEARQHGNVLTIRWGLATNQTIDGVEYATGVAPRLSTYRWSGTRWRLVSHANFNVPA